MSQQHPTCGNMVAKRKQHVAPNSDAICTVEMLWSFGRGLMARDPFLEVPGNYWAR